MKALISDNSTPASPSQLESERSLAMNASIQAKMDRIKTSTGKTVKEVVTDILVEYNLKLRK